jgi:hypothetical protein
VIAGSEELATSNLSKPLCHDPRRPNELFSSSVPLTMTNSQHLYEIRPRADKHGVDLISDVLPFGLLWYAGPNAISNAIGYAKLRSRSDDAVIRVDDEAGNVIETQEHTGNFREF